MYPDPTMNEKKSGSEIFSQHIMKKILGKKFTISSHQDVEPGDEDEEEKKKKAEKRERKKEVDSNKIQ